MNKLILIVFLPIMVKANIKSEIKLYIENHSDIQFKEIVYKQFIWETGHFKSKLFLKYNNLAGIKYNSKGYCKGKVRGYAKYSSWKDCIEDYIRIQQKILRKYPSRNNKEYLVALRKYGYSEVNYFNKIKV